mmetsp:Transcript_12095/g.36323  ORF Transcript_12095/g.36323 Transcript_12095/m.36323 type:complete len:267 (-) Transcript_12095:719-1519(-)
MRPIGHSVVSIRALRRAACQIGVARLGKQRPTKRRHLVDVHVRLRLLPFLVAASACRGRHRGDELRRAARGGEAEHHQEQRRPPRPIATPAERQPEAVLLQRGALKRHGGVQTSTGAAGMSVLSVASRAQESPTLDLVIAMPGLVRLDLCHRMGCGPHREERGGEERRGEGRGGEGRGGEEERRGEGPSASSSSMPRGVRAARCTPNVGSAAGARGRRSNAASDGLLRNAKPYLMNCCNAWAHSSTSRPRRSKARPYSSSAFSFDP